MRRISDIGAAVIGSGFIGTVHIEALRRLGVQVHGLLEDTPEHGAKRARPRSASRAPRPTWMRCSPTSGSRSSTSRRRTSSTSPRCSRILAAGQARRVREAAGHHLGGIRGAGAPGAPRGRVVNAVNFNIRFYPLNQHSHQAGARRRPGRDPPRHRPLLPGLALLDTDWNWRLDPAEGGIAAGGRRHRLALARPHQLRRRDRIEQRDGRPPDVRQGPPAADRARRDVLDRARRGAPCRSR